MPHVIDVCHVCSHDGADNSLTTCADCGKVVCRGCADYFSYGPGEGGDSFCPCWRPKPDEVAALMHGRLEESREEREAARKDRLWQDLVEDAPF